jgi:uncharacterized protein YcfJ
MTIGGRRMIAAILSATLLATSPLPAVAAPARTAPAPAPMPPPPLVVQASAPAPAPALVETEKQRKAREKAEAKARKQAERAERRRQQEAERARHPKSRTGKKLAHCAIGAAVGVLGALLLGGRQGRSAGGIVVGAVVGCAAGWALGEALKGDDPEKLDAVINQDVAFRDGETRSWQAPNSGQTITIQQADAGYKPVEADFILAPGVAAPQPGVLIQGRALRSTTKLRMRSSPSMASDDNIIGSFDPNEIVQVFAETPDGQWALIGENNMLIGYASMRFLSPSLEIPPQMPIRYAVLKRAPPPRARAGRAAATRTPAPVVAQAPQTVRIAASSRCKTFTASAGANSQSQRRCAQPNANAWA